MTKIISRDTFEIIHSAVNKAVNLIRLTYGPAGNKVIISKVLNKMVVDDGVQIARDLELEDPAENAVLSVFRETAIKTNDLVGDGTTSSLIMLQAIINEVAKLSNKNGRRIEKDLKKGFEDVKKQLLAAARPIKTKEELEKVARISFDDPEIAKIIADTWFKLGQNGVITIDRSGTMATFAEITEGITINNGFLSPYMVTNGARMEAIVEKPYILITDYRMTEAKDILPIMNVLAENKINNLVIIADNIENNALATVIINKMQGKFNVVGVNAPSGDDRTTFLEDMAMMTGARFFSATKGDKLETAQLRDLGRAERFVSHRDRSVVVGPKAAKGIVEKSIKELEEAMKTEAQPRQKEALKKRLAQLANKIAVIKVGAATENEMRALKYKVEDAVNAVRVAFRGGVVCGAGMSLARLKTSSSLLNEALKAPSRQLRDNMGLEQIDETDGGTQVHNMVTGQTGEFMKVGVVDPVEVLIAGVESAVSIASLLITTTGMIVEEEKKPEIQ